MKKMNLVLKLAPIYLCMLFYLPNCLGQAIVEIDSTTEIRMNSTSNKPHLRIYEDDLSQGGSCRIEFKHVANPSDKFEIRSFNATSQKRWSLYYNNTRGFTYNGSNNSFGIGTDIPDEKLHVKFSGADGIKIEGNGSGDARLWIKNQTGNHFIFDDNSDDHTLVLSSSNGLRFNTSGFARFLISETGQFTFNGDIEFGRMMTIDTDNQLYALEVDNENTSTAVAISGVVDGGNTGNKFGLRGTCLSASGNGTQVGVYGTSNTTPANSYAFYASGDIFYSGDLVTMSDSRFKTNVSALPPMLEKVMQLAPKSYEYRRKEYPSINLANGTQYGFIAQEVAVLFPDLVETNRHHVSLESDEYIEFNSMQYLELIPVLTKAIQDQQDIINQQNNRIQQLESRLSNLENE